MNIQVILCILSPYSLFFLAENDFFKPTPLKCGKFCTFFLKPSLIQSSQCQSVSTFWTKSFTIKTLTDVSRIGFINVIYYQKQMVNNFIFTFTGQKIFIISLNMYRKHVTQKNLRSSHPGQSLNNSLHTILLRTPFLHYMLVKILTDLIYSLILSWMKYRNIQNFIHVCPKLPNTSTNFCR